MVGGAETKVGGERSEGCGVGEGDEMKGERTVGKGRMGDDLLHSFALYKTLKDTVL